MTITIKDFIEKIKQDLLETSKETGFSANDINGISKSIRFIWTDDFDFVLNFKLVKKSETNDE